MIPFWWLGSGLVIPSSWRDAKVTVGSPLLLFFLTRLITLWSPTERSVGTKYNKGATKTLPKLDLLFPLIHHDLSDRLHPWSWSGNERKCNQSQTSRIQTPVRKNLGSTLQQCSYYRHKDFKMFGVFGTKGTVCYIIIEVWGEIIWSK